MTLSDIAVKRPVMAGVVSALIVVIGILGYRSLPLRELPNVDQPVVSVSTTYPGASADVVENRITQIIEDQLSGIEGVELISSSSRDGRSSISIIFSLSRNMEAAANDVRDAVSRVSGALPQDIDAPRVAKQDSDAQPIIWYSLIGDGMTMEELSDYAQRFIVDRLSTIDGVANVRIGGERRYAMRIWLDPHALAARRLTVDDIDRALRAQNLELPGGALESDDVDLTVRVERNYADPEAFRLLPVGNSTDGHVIRLGEVAEVEIGPREERALFRGNGVTRVGLGVVRQSQANALDVANGVRAEVERLRVGMPENMEIIVTYDSTVFISESIREVWRTLIVAALLVVFVIYIFLGSFRAAAIPAIVVPVCLIGAFGVLAAFGLTINIITLLALVLCIGLVVDDSIVVLENIQRRVDMGERPALAAFNGARQVFFAVIATTAVVVAVFAPLVVLPGIIGRIFTELAITMSGAVILSSLVALTLSPMMASKMLKPANKAGGVAKVVDRLFTRLRASYRNSLEIVLGIPWISIPLIVAALGGSIFLLDRLPSELTPSEDRGFFFSFFQGPEGAGFDYTARQAEEIEAILADFVERDEIRQAVVVVPGFGGGGFNSGVAFGAMAPWDERERSGQEIIGEINQRFGGLTGVRAFAGGGSSLGRGASGNDIQFVLGGSDYDEINRWADEILLRARESNPNLLRARKSYEPNSPRLIVDIDRERAAALGVSVQSIGRALEAHLGSRRVGTYADRGEDYDVVLQNRRVDRSSQSDLSILTVRADSGALIPLSNLVSLRETGESSDRPRVNRLRAITISATLAEGYTIGDAIEWFSAAGQDILPPTIQTDFIGSAKDFMDSNSATIFAFSMALLIVFLVLAAQFESLIQPLVIMLTVPLAVAGGLFGLYMVGSSLNVYSQIGLIVLVGLAAKNGILIVEFANQLRDEGLTVREATLQAADTRLRPILMTGLSTAIGALPLVLASGAGAESRVTIGIVIFTGVLVATLFTLVVVPAAYSVLGRFTKTPNWVSRQIERQQASADEQQIQAPAE